MKSGLGSIILVLIVVAIAVGGGYFYYRAEQPEVAYAEALEKVRQAMRDPSSVQFRNLHHGVTEDFVCGELNAKNGMGGYVGFRRFYATNAGLMNVWQDGDEASQDAETQQTFLAGQTSLFATNCALIAGMVRKRPLRVAVRPTLKVGRSQKNSTPNLAMPA